MSAGSTLVPGPAAQKNLEGKTKTETKATATSRDETRSVLRVWWPEMTLCVLVFLTLGAIVGLRVSDGKPLPKLPYKMSINTLVAAYILVMKAAILVIISNGLGQLKWAWFSSDKPRPLEQLGLLDDASHDLQGAMMWLWKMRVGLSIPSAGAIIFILATILDPFGQQIIRFYSCTVPDNSIAASIATTHIPQTFHYADSAPLHPKGELSGAIYQGLYTTRLPQVPFRCASGECRFPHEYHSVGLCSRCVDVTNRVTIQRPNNLTLAKLNLSDVHQKTELHDNTVFRLPFGLNATSHRPFLVDVAATIGANITFSAALGREDSALYRPDMHNSITFSILLGLFASKSESLSFERQSIACDTPDMWGCRGYGAAECSMYPCVKTFRGVVRAGVFSDTPVSESTSWACPSNSSLCSTINVACLTDAEKNVLLSRGYSFKPGDSWMSYNLSDYAQSAYDRFHSPQSTPLNDPNLFDDVTDIRPECIYQSSLVEWYYLALYMLNHFSELGGDTNTTTGLMSMLNNVFYDGGNISTASIERRFTRMAHAMSAAYQEMGTSTRSVGENSSFHNTSSTSWVTGEGLRNDTCVSVQWPWIAYPAVLSVATLVFLFLTVLHTSWHHPSRIAPELGRHDYKTSVVPLLLHGLYYDRRDERGRRPYEDVGTVRDKMKSARGMYVRFEKTEVGWRLVGG
ncbi:hypothetical protein B0T16DRAFT_403164 [Cercophora newfieldiana]|uniref:Uncharacterized protein n=1 Tax=Cercophora newfieldiana TaxID=92897 RepID=A0AA40CTS5_9PEZI|nr:hypothetical protein B0T16DRAFT_403164 [Cercophora newfieldiana]